MCSNHNFWLKSVRYRYALTVLKWVGLYAHENNSKYIEDTSSYNIYMVVFANLSFYICYEY